MHCHSTCMPALGHALGSKSSHFNPYVNPSRGNCNQFVGSRECKIFAAGGSAPRTPRQGAPPPGPPGEKSRFYGELVLTGMQKTTFLENCNPVRIPLRQDPTVGSGFLGPPVLRTKTDPCSGKHPKYTSVSPEISNGFNNKSNLNKNKLKVRRLKEN